MPREQKSLASRIVEVAESIASQEGLSPPNTLVVVVDRLYKPKLGFIEGLDVDPASNTLIVEKSTLDNMVYRILAGVFYLSYWNTFGVSDSTRAKELARKHFFKVLIALSKGSS